MNETKLVFMNKYVCPFQVILYYHNFSEFLDCHTSDAKIEKGDTSTDSFRNFARFSNRSLMAKTNCPATVKFRFEVQDEQSKTAHMFFWSIRNFNQSRNR